MPAGMKKRLFANAGTAAIEFGLIAPFLLILLAGTVEIGFTIWQQMAVYAAAEAGAGYAIKSGWNAAAISSAVVNATDETSITASPAPVEFCGCPAASGVTTVVCTATCTGGSTPSIYVKVSAAIPHPVILSDLGLPIPATLTATATVRLQ
jgi:Flp pilus assembly protein TadG